MVKGSIHRSCVSLSSGSAGSLQIALWGFSSIVIDYTGFGLISSLRSPQQASPCPGWRCLCLCHHNSAALREIVSLEARGDPATYARLLQVCSNVAQGKLLHARIIEDGLENDLFLGNHLVHMYGKCGSLEDAQCTFRKLPWRNVFSWTLMISNYVEHDQFEEALLLFRKMQLEGVMPNRITFVSILKECTNLQVGKLIHATIVETGFESEVVLGSTLVNMYGKCGRLENAVMAFDKIHDKNVVSWTAMVSTCVENGQFKAALRHFRQMQLEGKMPNGITYATIIDACGSLGILGEGKLIHSQVVEGGFESDIVMGTALVDMYGKCHSVEDARAMFEKLQHRDVICWSCMIAVYAEHDHGREALQLFRAMRLEGMMPDKVTFVSILNACETAEDLLEGKLLHASILESGFDSDIAVGNALINMYGKCGEVEEAYGVFEKICHRAHAVSWSTMVAVCVQKEHYQDGLDLFRKMQLEGILVEKTTFIAALNASAGLTSLQVGKVVRACILECGIELDMAVATALVSMYGKCGSIETAYEVFCRMPERDVVSWNSLIGVYAEHGQASECLEMFGRMHQDCVKPDGSTFIKVFSACSHAGLVEEGWCQLVSMRNDFGMVPTQEHFVCMIDLLGRAGQLAEAEELIRKMPFQANAVMWMSLLSACGVQNHLGRGKCAAERVLQLDLEKTSAYVVLSNIYSAVTNRGSE